MSASFLFLQGVCSPFFDRLGRALRERGHAVRRVNYTVGDAAYWRGGQAHAYRGAAQACGDFYAELLERHAVSDIVLFGDRRPVHRPAVALARARGVRVHVFEEGYFRPHWVTLERGGVNAHSSLPRDPAWYRASAARVPQASPRAFRSPFWLRAWHDVAYHACNAWNPLLFPRYRTHAPHGAAREYAAYVRRALRLRARRAEDARAMADLAARRARFFLLPLQLDSDAQIRDHSPYGDMREVQDAVMASFARHAPPDCLLVVKNHPLDPGFVDQRRVTAETARRHGLQRRVRYLETGHLPGLLAHAAGVVTVNSTVGSAALAAGCATLALSRPIYAMPGLTCQHTLDDFWRDPTPPQAALFAAFQAVVIHATQVNGGFYCAPGIDLAVANAVGRLTAPRSALEELL
ncbi:capsule polysaccharide biosynthesis protein [Bordetella bronchiseptica E014]|uniref:capsule biosynthesis protein n=2 Tax=Bordetella bronchiseptica TaxID=518 RepID=UPI00028AA97C|nr:capsular biosynthesis protein [Bordetella bronchiseptica]KCV28766.1 capsule polysaccharide biosynthesis protein [Bordetella bronchiseptica 00-P-2730]KDD53234.1 capsule polysaccharide biosynthesis protein [Bordetella bronchiseptica OSU553]AUL15451.1 capsule biosynthesis protein CapA [Bordetella bronchiseptica]AWP58550.1 capsule biosynthesis protein CapA [Bordetella bronchiseptica]AWQ05285.1 capsule biosynthesis protein CapA [Bordetella bronchiseptica]